MKPRAARDENSHVATPRRSAQQRAGSRAARTSGSPPPSRCSAGRPRGPRPVAGLVVDLPGRALDRVEDDVLVVARRPFPRAAAPAPGTAGRACSRATAFFHATISSSRSTCDDAERGRELAQAEVQPVDVVVGLAVVAERARELDQLVCRETSMPPSPVEIVFVAAERPDARVAPGAWPAGRATWRRGRGRSPRSGRCPARGSSSAIRSTSNAMWPPMCTRKTAFGRCSAPLRSKSSNDMQRSSRLQSTNSTARRRRRSRQRRRHEGVRRAEHRVPPDREARARRARRRSSSRWRPTAIRSTRTRLSNWR